MGQLSTLGAGWQTKVGMKCPKCSARRAASESAALILEVTLCLLHGTHDLRPAPTAFGPSKR